MQSLLRGFRRGGGFDFFSPQRRNLADGVDTDQSVTGIGVEGKTAPGPILRVIDQSSLQRIHVHVVKLLDSLLQAPDVEVVKPSLPHSRLRRLAAFKVQIQLSSGRSLLAAQAARDSLLQNLNHSRRRSLGRLSDQQMNVIRHDHVTHQRKTIAVPDLAENLNKHIPGTNRTKQRHAPITTEGNEVKMPAPVDPNEFVGHGGEETQKPRPFEKREGSATRKSKTVTSL